MKPTKFYKKLPNLRNISGKVHSLNSILEKENAVNKLGKSFFKITNNSVFGKTIKNLKNKVNVKLVTDDRKFQKLLPHQVFFSQKTFNEYLVAVCKIREVLILNNSVYVRTCILDLSKILMCEIHYI